MGESNATRELWEELRHGVAWARDPKLVFRLGANRFVALGIFGRTRLVISFCLLLLLLLLSLIVSNRIMSSSILHQCPFCGHVSDISLSLAAFIENPHCSQVVFAFNSDVCFSL